MASIKLPQEIVDALAQGEADALLEGLRDPETRQNPAFLSRVRQFLKDNDFVSTTEIEGIKSIKYESTSVIPDLIADEEDTIA